MISFGARVRAAVEVYGALCVGIDPHVSLLADWGLDASAAGAREFGLRVVDAAAGRAGIVKPQVSFFERYGSAGFAALEDVLAAARAAGLVVIADAKRGDIGTTMDAYAAAWLTPGSPLEADALTVSPYLGVGALASTFDLAVQHGKGAFVLAATSNPEAERLQRGVVGEGTVAGHVIAEVSAWAEPHTAPGEWSSLGFVVGATIDRHERGISDFLHPPAPILAPGFGAQGAQLGDVRSLFGALTPYVLASESRSILSGGPAGLTERITSRQETLKEGRRG